MKLVVYTNQMYPFVENYQLSDEQLQFTSSPQQVYPLLQRNNHRQLILGIEKETCVTAFVLHGKEGVQTYTKQPTSLFLGSFSTDFRFQGHGYGTKTLALLPLFIQTHFPDCHEIFLTVNEKNQRAFSLYQKSGFIDTGYKQKTESSTLLVLKMFL